MSISTIQTRIDEAKTARHELAMGGLRSWMVSGRTYTTHSLGELDQYIRTLEAELAEAEDAEAGYGFVPMQIERPS